MSTTITVSNPSYDKIYTIQAWEDNNRTLKLVQGEGIAIPDGASTVEASRVKAPRFQLRDRQGVISLSSGSPDIAWAVQRPQNGGEDLLACNIVSAADGIIEIPITTSVTEYAGDAYGEIRVTTSIGEIKFFGINACIGEGVSDDAAAQSSRFSDLLNALQQVVLLNNNSDKVAKMDTLDSNGKLKTGVNGTNPVSSDNLNTYLHNAFQTELQEDFISYQSITGNEIDSANNRKVLYFHKIGGNPTGIVFFTEYNNYNGSGRQVCQFRLCVDGHIEYRLGTVVGSTIPNQYEWDEWTTILTNEFQDLVKDVLTKEYELLSPDKTYNVHKEKVANYLEGNGIDNPFDSNYENSALQALDGETSSETINRVFGYENHGRPNKVALTIPTGGVKIRYYDTVTGHSWTESTTGSISYISNVFYIQNLIPNHLYIYRIYNATGEIIQSGSCQASGKVRMINAGGDTYNIRDIGGWECDSGSIKYGVVYRGGELNNSITLSAESQSFMKNALGIRDEIDLRGSGSGDTALGLGVTYIHLPLQYSPHIFNDAYIDESAALIKRIAQNIRDNKPMYIHCQAGADRTGLACMFLEAICGVAQNDIDRDYELTSFSKQATDNTRILRPRNNEWANAIKGAVAVINQMEGTDFNDKIVRFLLRAGVSIDDINAIRLGLIEGSPAKLTSPYQNATITKTLTGIQIDNALTSIERHQPYKAILIPDNMYKIQSVSVTMGGTDITSSVYSRGIINIPHVTGNLIITATATLLNPVIRTKWDAATSAANNYSVPNNVVGDVGDYIELINENDQPELWQLRAVTEDKDEQVYWWYKAPHRTEIDALQLEVEYQQIITFSTTLSTTWSGSAQDITLPNTLPNQFVYGDVSFIAELSLDNATYTQLQLDGCSGIYLTSNFVDHELVLTAHYSGHAPSSTVNVQIILTPINDITPQGGGS